MSEQNKAKIGPCGEISRLSQRKGKNLTSQMSCRKKAFGNDEVRCVGRGNFLLGQFFAPVLGTASEGES